MSIEPYKKQKRVWFLVWFLFIVSEIVFLMCSVVVDSLENLIQNQDFMVSVGNLRRTNVNKDYPDSISSYYICNGCIIYLGNLGWLPS